MLRLEAKSQGILWELRQGGCATVHVREHVCVCVCFAHVCMPLSVHAHACVQECERGNMGNGCQRAYILTE